MFVAVDKPVGLSSHDVVDVVRGITGVKRVGHAGTLDPLASGVLVIAIGRASTKQIHSTVKSEKEYICEVILGFGSETDDGEGGFWAVSDARPSVKAVVNAVATFVGRRRQTPPVYSAIKIGGTTSYAYARRGKPQVLGERMVDLYAAEVLDYSYPLVTVRLVTGPGYYVRSLARDLGALLGTGGFVGSLRRTRVGSFTLAESVYIDQLQEWYAAAT